MCILRSACRTDCHYLVHCRYFKMSSDTNWEGDQPPSLCEMSQHPHPHDGRTVHTTLKRAPSHKCILHRKQSHNSDRTIHSRQWHQTVLWSWQHSARWWWRRSSYMWYGWVTRLVWYQLLGFQPPEADDGRKWAGGVCGVRHYEGRRRRPSLPPRRAPPQLGVRPPAGVRPPQVAAHLDTSIWSMHDTSRIHISRRITFDDLIPHSYKKPCRIQIRFPSAPRHGSRIAAPCTTHFRLYT